MNELAQPVDGHDIVPPHLALKSMRSSGFKSTDYAVAELIDNSVQSGIKLGNDVTNIEVICIQRQVTIGSRSTKRISEILVFDDAGGMNAELLGRALSFGQGTNLNPEDQTGIGKYGMGLPNASISQCQYVGVYSWQDNKTLFTCLNVRKVLDGTQEKVPPPIESEIPSKYRTLISADIQASGTLVEWRDLDKVTWVRHRAFFKNSEFLIGRVYRRFISDGSVKIRLAAYDATEDNAFELLEERFVRPNDPLMLMERTSAPEPYSSTPAFEEFGRKDDLQISLPGGKSSEVSIRYSVAKNEARESSGNVEAGNLDIGKYVNRNTGVSIVRAGRELELNQSWVVPSDPTERWWSIEIEFQPELDDVFGVTNDKQAATNLYRCDIADDAETLEISVTDLEDELRETSDGKLANYEVSRKIAARLRSLRKHVKEQRKATRASQSKKRDAEESATKATEKRAAIKATEADKAFADSSPEQRQEAIKKAFVESGFEEEAANARAVEAVSSGTRYIFSEAEITSPVIFDLSQQRGEYFIKLNTRHPAYDNFIELLRNEDSDEDSRELVALKLLLTAWARMEDEAARDPEQLEALQDARIEWGRLARDFLKQHN